MLYRSSFDRIAPQPRRGMLPEIVADGITGHLFDDTAEGLAAALAPMIEDPEQAARLGHAAREKAEAFYDTPRVAEDVEQALDRARVGR